MNEEQCRAETEHKSGRLGTEAALRASEERLRQIEEHAPIGLALVALDGRFTRVNPALCALTGYTKDELLGMTLQALTHPGDRAADFAYMSATILNGAIANYEVEKRDLHKNGDVVWVLLSLSLVRDEALEPCYFIAQILDISIRKQAEQILKTTQEASQLLNARLQADISARKRAESALRLSDERFRQIEEHSRIGLALVALDGTFTRVNPALCAMTGFCQAELLLMTVQALLHPDDREADLVYVQRMLDSTIASYEMEKRYFHKDGHIVWTLVSRSLVRDEWGTPLYVIAQSLDISERKAAERALEIAQELAGAAAQAKARFVAAMSHEIRTPMSAVIGMTELLLMSHLSDEQREYLKIVRDSGQSLLRVLNDILDYSKIEAGKLDLEIIDFNLSTQIKSIIALMEPQFKTRRVTLTIHVGLEVPSTLKGDPGRVRQILVNLIGNALKFTPAGGSVRIIVDAKASAEGTIPVRFTVIDTGVGIGPQALPRLFQPFSQVDDSTTRTFGGTGLGLSICKQLVDLMSGEIGVTSTAGLGSSFWFLVPFARASGCARLQNVTTGEVTERRAAVAARPESILLAEDNEVNSFLARKQFKSLGFEITVVTNGREAVTAASDRHFDAVFMDCHMPIMDGFDATRAIRALSDNDNNCVPIVALTANAQSGDREICLAAGMDDYVPKPMSLPDLRTVLARWVPQAAARLSV